MTEGNLHTTNILLGVMASASVLQILVLIGMGVLAYRLYRQTLQVVRDIERRQIAPVSAEVLATIGRLDGILNDVKNVTTRVTQRTARVDSAIDHTIDRVDETAGRVRDSFGSGIHQLIGFVHGVTAAARGLLGPRRPGEGPAA